MEHEAYVIPRALGAEINLNKNNNIITILKEKKRKEKCHRKCGGGRKYNRMSSPEGISFFLSIKVNMLFLRK